MIRRVVGCFVLGLIVAAGAGAVFAAEPAAAVQPPVPAPVPAPAPAPDGPAPHIKFDATDINLGDVVHGQDAVATFVYHNTGTAPLHILSAKPG
jgi:hypothetical protein